MIKKPTRQSQELQRAPLPITIDRMGIEAGQNFSLWTIRAAVLCWFVFAWLMLSRSSTKKRSEKTHSAAPIESADRRFQVHPMAGWLWIVATLLLAIHIASAFAFFHQGSHSVAAEHTAQRTEEFIGLYWSGGIWFNYLFLFICVVEAVCWFRNSELPSARKPIFNWCVYGMAGFMIFNAGVVFVHGAARWINLAGFVILGWRYWFVFRSDFE